MKTMKFLSLAALALTFAACSSDDNDFAQQPQKAEGITITATLAPKTNGAATRAVEDKTTYIEASWKANEHIAILYTVGSDKKMADATITDVDGSGVATITFTVDGSTADGTACEIVYPLSAAKTDNSGMKAYADMLTAQDGVLDGDLDVRVGTGTIHTSSSASLDVTTQPAAQFAIFKFTLGSAIDGSHPLTIKDNADNMITTVTPTESKTAVYVALEPATDKYYKFSATTADNKIISKSSTATIAVGTFYQTELACPALGDLYYSDGTYSSTLQTGKTAIGVIAYLGTDNFTENGTTVGGSAFVGHGLVMCLKNAASDVAWSTNGSSQAYTGNGFVTNVNDLKRSTGVSGYLATVALATDATTYPAAAAAKNYTGLAAPATGTTGWFLPSAQQWVKMQTGLGALAESSITFGSWYDNSHTAADKWEAALAKAGTGNYDSMTNAYLWYWSSSEYSAEYAAYLGAFATDTSGSYGFRWINHSKANPDAGSLVRPVLAF